MVKLKSFFLLIVVVGMHLSCMKHVDADLVVHNGTIYTCDIEFSTGQAIAIKDGIVLEIGPEHQILNKYNPKEKLDLKKKTVVPAFFDAHSYLLAKTLKSNAIDFEGLNKVQLNNSSLNYIYNVPSKELETLDFPNYRFVIRSISGNEIALDKNTYQAIFLNSTDQKMTITNKDSIAEVIAYLEKNELENYSSTSMMSTLFENGYSGCTSFGVNSKTAEKIINENNSSFYHQVVLSGNSENFEWLTKKGRSDSGNVHLKGLSYFIDGGFGAKEALLKNLYSAADTHGKLFTDSFTLSDIPALCASLNFQLIFHAYGDSAFAVAAEKMGQSLNSVNDSRWRIEHNQLVDLLDLKKLKSYSILPSVQPTQATSDKGKISALIGKERDCSSYNFASLFDQNQFIASGSLYPINELNPFEQFKALIKSDQCAYPVDRKAALKSITIWPAMLAFFDNKTGSLEAGKSADFVVLNINIMKAPFDKISDTKVQRTYVKGQLEYKID